MALSDGDLADARDTWSRIITDPTYWKKDGTMHNRAFTGKAIAPPLENRSWSHELSGRLLSLIASLKQESEDICLQKSRPFEGIMYREVAALCAMIDGDIKADVRYTPIANQDRAHSDFVTYNTVEAHRQAIRDFLQETVRALKPANIAHLESLRVDLSTS
jgi:hypothetical protein